jgi:DNA-binding IclR family transcriptional regulator
MSGSDRIEATKTAFEILDVIAESRGATAAELIEATGLSRGGVYKHLRTLVEVDALANSDGKYELGPKFTEYGLGAGDTHVVLDQTEKVDELARSLDAPANLWANDDSQECRCVYITDTDDRTGYPRTRGDTEALTQSPAGKVILAHLSQGHRDDLIEDTHERLPAQLDELRERQLLDEPLPFAPEWVSIATPVLDPSDQPVGAIEIVIPVERARGIDVKNNISGLLTETANRMRVAML